MENKKLKYYLFNNFILFTINVTVKKENQIHYFKHFVFHNEMAIAKEENLTLSIHLILNIIVITFPLKKELILFKTIFQTILQNILMSGINFSTIIIPQELTLLGFFFIFLFFIFFLLFLFF